MREDLKRSAPIQTLAWSAVEQHDDTIEISFLKRAEICPLGKELPQQAVGVLIAGPFPG